MDRRAKLICPFLLGVVSTRWMHLYWLVPTYPGQPGATVGSKGEVPCWLESLEILVWLEKGSIGTDGVDEAESEQCDDDVCCADGKPML